MELHLNSLEISLVNNQPVSLRRAQGQRIICIFGTIWITVSGHATDIFLQRGESHVVSSKGLVIVESIGNGCFCIEQYDQPSALAGLLRQVPTRFRSNGCSRIVLA